LFLTVVGLSFVMPRLVPGITSFGSKKGVDGRVKPGHDGLWSHSGAMRSIEPGIQKLFARDSGFALARAPE